MKRACLTALLVAVLVSGCAAIDDLMELLPKTEDRALPSVGVAPTPIQVYPPTFTTAARILDRGEMVVGIRYDLEPFSYVDENSNIVGLEIDLARELARRWLGNPAAVRFRQVRSDTAIQKMVDGEVDFVLAGIVHTQQAEAQVDFSPAYFTNGQAFLTFPELNVRTADDLYSRKIGVVTWTGSDDIIYSRSPQTITLVPYENFFEVVEALRTRQVDAYGDQRHRLERARRMVTGTEIVGQYTMEPVALVYRHNDPFFANLVSMTFQDMAADGSRDALYEQWLPGTSPPAVTYWPGSAPTPALSETPQLLSTLNVSQRIYERGAVVVGYFTDRWPYSADREDGVPTGFEVRLMQRMAERWLGSRQAITFTAVTEADALVRLQQGEVDLLLGGWVHTRDGELQGDYSIAVFDDGVSILSPGYAPVNDVASLAGSSVGVVANSAGAAALPSISQGAGVGLSPVTYPDTASALNALSQGEIAALFARRGPLLDAFYRQVGYSLADQRYTYRPVAFVLPEGDSAFRDRVNLTLAALAADGSFAELYVTWFDDPVPDLETWPGQPA
ncbi:MAG: transporter substrate-binding domain-containing protein, partial [Anaerolineae bacterium]|nr:transporter substrate-binding domain-containing protein [Anaerolineae bacterium]